MSSRWFASALALVTSFAGLSAVSCGGGVDDIGSYCVVLSPPTHDFGCDGGSIQVSVTNECEFDLSLDDPLVDVTCEDRVSTSLVTGLYDLAPGESADFDITYSPVGTGAWDCQVSFSHDLASASFPVLSLSGGGDLCE